MTSVDHVRNRDKVVQTLSRELMGPSPSGEVIDWSKAPFEDIPFVYVWNESAEPEEILRDEQPHLRYGVGVLYAQGTTAVEQENAAEEVDIESLESKRDSSEQKESKAFGNLPTPDGESAGEEDELRIESANRFQPASLGVSFLVDVDSATSIGVQFSGGRYEPKDVEVFRGFLKEEEKEKARTTKKQTWYLRKPVAVAVSFVGEAILAKKRGYINGKVTATQNLDSLRIEIRCFVKQVSNNPGQRLLTIVAVNESQQDKLKNCVYQCRFTVTTSKGATPAPLIMPYPMPSSLEDDEESQISLLYRQFKTFAVGHGCAANWKGSYDRAYEVSAEPLPMFEAPSTTHDIKYRNANGEVISVPQIEINLLADMNGRDRAIAELSELANHYIAWIKSVQDNAKTLPNELRKAALSNLEKCGAVEERMREGIKLLQDPTTWKAFAIANQAMLLQRHRSKLAVRQRTKTGFGAYPSIPDLSAMPSAKWRPFQIAFLLQSMASSVLTEHNEREVVDLIWFPTGGGKTEAYLALSAFVAVYRRLTNLSDGGTAVLMRYTLRLLTQQQMLRASSLICALEYLRTKMYQKDLGPRRFAIGLWVGGSVTPSDRSEAVQILHSILKGRRQDSNLLVLTRCPWCAAEMKVDYPSATKGVVDGAVELEQTVKYACPDPACMFHIDAEDTLPVEFIDEDLYDRPPTIIVGTIDKFATMHGEKARKARSLFGFSEPDANDRAQRVTTPPSLIIQDELHLISGPLGSTAGLYESLIEELCIDSRSGKRVRPKIVCSTATIRGYRSQVEALYGRQDTRLFPPSGIDAGDSFFAQYARDKDGELAHGKLFVGVHPTGFTSGQTSRVRTFSALLQAPIDLVSQYDACNAEAACPYKDDKAECQRSKTNRNCRRAQDPWWTLLIFFNSLRDLGNAISLFQTDLPDYRRVVRRRRAVDMMKMRHAYQPMELTSRLKNTEIPTRLASLEVSRDSDVEESVDVCLASNIIEVGIDVDRLSLMCVVAQPKTTSTYIQVTGRVGRNWSEKPGLVVTIYAADRPRDRSHFEHFRTYHERLYAQVEPTSVTPYSRPLLERALHGVIAAYIRMLGNEEESDFPRPFPETLYREFVNRLLARARRSGFSDEEMHISSVAGIRMNKWRQKGPSKWLGGESDCLLEPATGNPLQEQRVDPPFSTPFSMRNVDAGCEMRASDEYMNPDAYPIDFEVSDE